VLQDAAADDRIEGLVFIRKAGVVVELRETHGGVLVERGEALYPVDVASTELDPRAELMADQARIDRVSASPIEEDAAVREMGPVVQKGLDVPANRVVP